MNRKMRSKLNNAEARKKRDCPNRGKLMPVEEVNVEENTCNTCGEELGQPVAVVVYPLTPKEKLN